MRYLLLPLVFCLFSCGDNTDNTVGVPVNTLPLDVRVRFEDFSPAVSSDGTKAAFVSLRSEPNARVYLYDASLTEKLVLFSDRAGIDTGEQEWLTSLSPDGNWVLVYREKAGSAGRVLLRHFSADATASESISLPENSSVDELIFDPNSQFFAVVQRTGGVRTLRLFSVSGNATAVSLQELQSFERKSHVRFVSNGSNLELVALDESSSGSRPIQRSTYDTGNAVFGSFSEVGTLSLVAAERPFAVSLAGYFSVDNYDSPHVKTATGTASDVATRTVSVIQKITQADIFSQQTFDFSATSYLEQEPVTVSALSLSPDGEYLLATSNDVVYCSSRSHVITFYRLIRRSDMRVLPISISRTPKTTPWTSAQTNACALDDSTESDFDRFGFNGQIVAVNGNSFVLMIESQASGDRESRLLTFTADWTAGTISDATLTEISSNPRS